MFKTAVPILASLNEQETIDFYVEKLGFTFHSSWDGYLIFSRDGLNIHLWPCENSEIPRNTGCYVNVSEVDALYAEYQAHNIIHPAGQLETKPWEMKQFSILDNNGNIIHFGEDVSEETD